MADSARDFQKSKGKGGSKGKGAAGSKLRGMDRDPPEVRISKTLSWLLRHSAATQGLAIRQDGYVNVDALFDHPKLKALSLDLEGLQAIVVADAKQRYDLVFEKAEEEGPTDDSAEPQQQQANGLAKGSWWIKANQGHSIKAVKLDLKPINSLDDIPSGIALHGTTEAAWRSIEKQGISKMQRNHIHLAQGASSQNAISGLRMSAQILIFIDIPKALDAGIQFSLSDNGVVLSEGDASGFIKPDFFSRVEDMQRNPIPGWEGSGPIDSKAVATEPGPSSTKTRNRGSNQKRTKPLTKAMEELAVKEDENNLQV